jgi:uncharacterized protein
LYCRIFSIHQMIPYIMPIIKKVVRPLFLLLLLLPVTIIAQQKESVLWKISGKDLRSPSWLYGTFHTVSTTLPDSFPTLRHIIRQCEYGIFEKSAHAIGNVQDAYIPTPRLDSVFTPEEYALVDSFFTQSPYGSIRPHNDEASLLAMLQAVVMLTQESTKHQDRFYDEYLQSYMLDSLQRKTFGLDEPVEMAESAKTADYKAMAKAVVYLIRTKVDASTLTDPELFDEKLYTSAMQANMRLQEDAKEKGIIDGR